MSERHDTARHDTARQGSGAQGSGAQDSGAQDPPRWDPDRQDTLPELSAVRPDRTISYPAGYAPGTPPPGAHPPAPHHAPYQGPYQGPHQGPHHGPYPSGPGWAQQGWYGAPPGGATAPDHPARRVAVRRPDLLAALLLLLAGLAAALSLLLPWVAGGAASGLDLVRASLDEARAGVLEPVESGLWQPLVVVLGGGVLAVLGLLLLVPARRHRFLGLLALLVAGAATAGVLVPLGEAGWTLDRFGPGFWCALAVAGLGLLGAVKAVLTRRRYR